MEKSTKRFFILGDSWIYYKIYSGVETSDLILKTVINSSMVLMLEKNLIKKWFFIRYADPDHHIRLRINFDSPEKLGVIIHQLFVEFNDLVDEDLIWKLQTDKYERELDRYGLNTINIAEEFFYHDSTMVVALLDLIEGNEGEEIRWLVSLVIINRLLDNFQFSIKDKFLLLEQLKTGFGNEFGMNHALKKQIDTKFRRYRKRIENFVNGEIWNDLEYAPLEPIIQKYCENVYPLAAELVNLSKKGQLEIDLNELVSSFIHMFMNRNFKSKNRIYEMVCYDFLFRYYQSAIAREKYRNKNV